MGRSSDVDGLLVWKMQVDGRILAPLRSCSSLLGTNSSDFAGFEGEFGDGWRAGGLKRSMHTDVSAARVGRRAPRVEESEVGFIGLRTEIWILRCLNVEDFCSLFLCLM